jgi:hypothetical protein
MKTKSFGSFILLFILFVLGTALTGCEQTVQLKDGLIPEEMIPHLQPALGNYRGQVERRTIGLTASLQDKHLVLQSSDDLIAPACDSKIGNLKQFSYKENKDKTIQITEAVFDFDPNLCGNDVLGRKLTFSMTGSSPISMNLSFLDHFEYRWRCDGGIVYPPGTAYPPGNCWQERIAFYNTGRFVHE